MTDAWGGSWGDSWGGSWGVASEVLIELPLVQFVLTVFVPTLTIVGFQGEDPAVPSDFYTDRVLIPIDDYYSDKSGSDDSDFYTDKSPDAQLGVAS